MLRKFKEMQSNYRNAPEMIIFKSCILKTHDSGLYDSQVTLELLFDQDRLNLSLRSRLDLTKIR